MTEKNVWSVSYTYIQEGPVAILFSMEVELHLFSCVH